MGNIMPQNILAEFYSEFGLRLVDTKVDPDAIMISASSVSSSAACPQCHQNSAKVHSGYTRTIADLSLGARKVIVQVFIRRFFCKEPGCERVTFAESISGFAVRHARRTNQLREALREIAFEAGGEGGTRMAEKLHYGKVSPDTLLRLIRHTPQPDCPTPRHLGVDDWAIKKGRTYGTILVDLETHTVVDLLAGRESDGLEKWLKDHPGVEIITRDRSGSYSEGAKKGAPHAIQIADRFHLLVNLTDTLKHVVQQNPNCLKLTPEQPPAPVEQAPAEKEPVPEPEKKQPLPASLAQKQALYFQIQDLHQKGVVLRDIAKSLGVCLNTAMKYANLPEPPAKQIRSSRKTAGFEQYIKQRWDEGLRGPKQLFLELRKLGYKGSYKTITRYAAELRGPDCNHRRSQEAPKAPPPRIAVSKAAFLLSKPVENLKEEENKLVQHLCQTSEQIKSAYTLAQSFQKMVRERHAEEFDHWLDQADQSIALNLRSFAAGLRRDYDAVKMALSHPLSNGQVEGQNNRLKLIKRKMQGRAKLDLLKQRVMYHQ
jgi:transposase